MAACKWHLCDRARPDGQRYCRKHQAAWSRPIHPLIIEPLDTSKPRRKTLGGPLRGCIEQYKRSRK
jgi:hypothetical protein